MRNRVFLYITQGEKLLVLDYLDHSYLEPQVPGGTIEPGESPEEAALREAREETGLVAYPRRTCDRSGGMKPSRRGFST